MSDTDHHTSAPRAPTPVDRFRRGFKRRAWTLLALIGAPACCLGGCSVSMPIASLVPGDAVTGSNSPVPFGRMLDEEDRRREKAALATALDPQGDGATVHWANEKSGAKGAITPAGRAYPLDGKVCRAFHADLHRDGAARHIDATACTAAAGEWLVREARSNEPVGAKG